MTNYLSSSLATEQMVLERIRIGAQQHVGNYVLQNMEVSQWVDHLTDGVALRFSSDVLAKTLETRTIDQRLDFESPASTWQMFKHAHRDGRWLGWLARRWPVRMAVTTKWVTAEAKSMAAFPDATIQFPKELGHPIFFQTVRAVSDDLR